MKSYIGIIGLGVMGENLARNIVRNGYSVTGLDIDEKKVQSFLTKSADAKATATTSPTEFLESLEKPRKILLLVKAGDTVDSVLSSIESFLSPGDILIDAGNESFINTERRVRAFSSKSIHFIGSGVSGGEEGALWGPAMMPGGDSNAWPFVKELFEKISAKAPDGTPCCAWMGQGGAGHFIKMVHNGIEYGDMQMIAESYALMRTVLGLSPLQIADVFSEWNDGELQSYLIEITADILRKVDTETGMPLIDVIQDSASQKGTGKLTAQIALDLGVATPTIAESVFARCLSALKSERVLAEQEYKKSGVSEWQGDTHAMLTAIKDALLCSKICSYAQGFQLLWAASQEYSWGLNFERIALIWRAGCIIRAQFLDTIADEFRNDPNLPNLIMGSYFKGILIRNDSAWRSVICLGIQHKISLPTFSSALSYFDGYTTARLPANIIQAQRDYFGAHTYERTDRQGTFHTHWAEDNLTK